MVKLVYSLAGYSLLKLNLKFQNPDISEDTNLIYVNVNTEWRLEWDGLDEAPMTVFV